MAVFNEIIRRKGQAEEDLYFAKLDMELIENLHKQQDEEQQTLDEILTTDSAYR